MESKAELIAAVGQVVAGLCLLGVVVWAAVEAVSADAAVGGSIVVAVFGLLGIFTERHWAEKARRREVQRERMEPAYKDFVWRAYRRFESKGAPMSPEDATFFTELKAKLLVLGADAAVVRAFVAFDRAERSEVEPDAVELAYEALLRSIRRDIGHRDKRLPKGELLRVFTDYE